MSDKPRKSLRQLADEAAIADGINPWACPRCGCTDWRTVDTRFRDGCVRRKRACRHCKTPLPTQELPCPPGFKLIAVPDDESDVA
jgi:hypothetical protein